MKRNYDSKHRGKEFEVGAWVYVRLQPYRQVSVALRRNAKLAPRYYGPFQILHHMHWTGSLQVGLALIWILEFTQFFMYHYLRRNWDPKFQHNYDYHFIWRIKMNCE